MIGIFGKAYLVKSHLIATFFVQTRMGTVYMDTSKQRLRRHRSVLRLVFSDDTCFASKNSLSSLTSMYGFASAFTVVSKDASNNSGPFNGSSNRWVEFMKSAVDPVARRKPQDIVARDGHVWHDAAKSRQHRKSVGDTQRRAPVDSCCRWRIGAKVPDSVILDFEQSRGERIRRCTCPLRDTWRYRPAGSILGPAIV